VDTRRRSMRVMPALIVALLAAGCDGVTGVKLARVEVWMYGQVTQAETGLPLEGASVFVQHLSRFDGQTTSTTSDEGAYFVRGSMFCTTSCDQDMYVQASHGGGVGEGIGRLVGYDNQIVALRIDIEVVP